MHDAVLVGAFTIRRDRPSLTVRAVQGRSPIVVVLDGALRLKPHELNFPLASQRRVIVCTTLRSVMQQRRTARALARQHVELFALPGRGNRLALADTLGVLHEGGIRSILVEGGGEVFRQFAQSGLADEWSIFVAPKLIGGGLGAFGGSIAFAPRLKEHPMGTLTSVGVGPDILIRGFVKKYPIDAIAL